MKRKEFKKIKMIYDTQIYAYLSYYKRVQQSSAAPRPNLFSLQEIILYRGDPVRTRRIIGCLRR